MKKLFFLTILCLLMLGIVTSLPAQTATGGCSTVTVTNTPSYNNSLYFGCNYYYVETCALFISSSFCPPKQAQYQLERKTDTGWSVVVSWQNASSFTNITTHGTYRVAVRIPVLVDSELCEDGCRKIFEFGSAQWIGCLGQWGATTYTNSVPVGNTVAADNSYFFTESTPSGSSFSMDDGEVVGMDASASKNYNYWYLAIFETGEDFNRSRGNGWTHGTVGTFDLSFFWAGGTAGWEFEPLHSYMVQFVVENRQCMNGDGWNNFDQSFFICPSGTGCRFDIGEREITLGPNPASSFIRLQNFEPDLDRTYDMVFTDLAGKTVKSVPLATDQVDISDLPGGMFVVNVLREGSKVFTSKLIVNKQ